MTPTLGALKPRCVCRHPTAYHVGGTGRCVARRCGCAKLAYQTKLRGSP